MSETPEVVDAQSSEAGAELARRDGQAEASPTQIVEHRTESPQAAQWRLRNTIAGRLVNTDFVPEAYRGKPDQVLACLAYGDEIGLGAMQSLQSIDVIKGKPTLKPETMRAMILGAGHSLVRIAASDTEVTFRGKRRDNGDEETVTFTFDQAKRLGLTSKDNWSKQPKAMLTARCTGEIARSLFPDVIRGASYTPEEMGDEQPMFDEPEGPIPMDPSPEPPFRIVTRDHRDAGHVVAGGGDTGIVTASAHALPIPAGHTRVAESGPKLVHHDPDDGFGEGEILDVANPTRRRAFDYHDVWDGERYIAVCNACGHDCDDHSEIRRGCSICACRNTFPDDDQAPHEAPPVVGDALPQGSTPHDPGAGLPLPASMFRAVHAALRDCGFGDYERHALIGWLTNGRTESSKGLTADDAEALLALLGKVKSGAIQVDFTLDGTEAEVTATNDRGVAFLAGLGERVRA